MVSGFVHRISPTISIHALLAESDPQHQVLWPRSNYFYPRSPCGERLSVARGRYCQRHYFYPRSPCGERRKTMPSVRHISYFYPRSPCGERLLSTSKTRQNWHFYPRSPCGERRSAWVQEFPELSISIHALLAESDSFWSSY